MGTNLSLNTSARSTGNAWHPVSVRRRHLRQLFEHDPARGIEGRGGWPQLPPSDIDLARDRRRSLAPVRKIRSFRRSGALAHRIIYGVSALKFRSGIAQDFTEIAARQRPRPASAATRMGPPRVRRCWQVAKSQHPPASEIPSEAGYAELRHDPALGHQHGIGKPVMRIAATFAHHGRSTRRAPFDSCKFSILPSPFFDAHIQRRKFGGKGAAASTSKPGRSRVRRRASPARLLPDPTGDELAVHGGCRPGSVTEVPAGAAERTLAWPTNASP